MLVYIRAYWIEIVAASVLALYAAGAMAQGGNGGDGGRGPHDRTSHVSGGVQIINVRNGGVIPGLGSTDPDGAWTGGGNGLGGGGGPGPNAGDASGAHGTDMGVG